MLSIWFYPVIAFFIVKGTRDNLSLRKGVLVATAGVSLMTVFGLCTGISTTLLELDTIFVTSVYFLVSLGVWIGIEQRQKLVRAICIVLGILIFGLGYISGTVGALGVGFVTMSLESTTVNWYDNGIIYKEKPLGNAISDFRGKEVEVYKTIAWLPIIEWRLADRQYFNSETYKNPLQVEYLSAQGTFILSLPDSVKVDGKIWKDTLRVEYWTK